MRKLPFNINSMSIIVTSVKMHCMCDRDVKHVNVFLWGNYFIFYLYSDD